MTFEIFLAIWLAALSAAFWYHIRSDVLQLKTLIARLERQDRRIMDVMDRIDKTLLKMITP